MIQEFVAPQNIFYLQLLLFQPDHVLTVSLLFDDVTHGNQFFLISREPLKQTILSSVIVIIKVYYGYFKKIYGVLRSFEERNCGPGFLKVLG